jgi:hypothetical protein
MTELSGTLDGIGLPAIVRFLVGLKKSGCLRLSLEDWQGQVFFEAGQVASASFGSRTGVVAFDALVEALPGANFDFDSQVRAPEGSTIELTQEALEAHLDELAARIESGLRPLPAPDLVPVLISADEASDGGDPVPLDRGTLQTLTLIDGQRTVRQIVAHRGSFDALWQVGQLVEVGLIRLQPSPSPVTASPPPIDISAPVAPFESTLAPAAAATPPVPTPAAVVPAQPEPAIAAAKCPRLGFEDDPSHSFNRPTRLHRCFAAGSPLPLSLDQQRELCLGEQFGTCPRLATAPNEGSRHLAPSASAAQHASTRHADQEGEHPRIVRLPFAARRSAAGREPIASAAAAPAKATGPTRLRPVSAPSGAQDTVPPTPLRARVQRSDDWSPAARVSPQASASATAVLEASTVGTRDPEPAPIDDTAAVRPEPRERRIANIPVGLIATVATVLGVVGLIVYLILPQSAALFGDDTIDPSVLPNTTLIAAGTPVSVFTAARATPVAGAADQSDGSTSPKATPDAAQPTPAPAQPTVASAQPAQLTAAPVAAAARTLLDERFTSNDANWPINAEAQITSGAYRIATHQAGQFVAIGAPIIDLPADVIVSATFHKLGGPSGGGYGIIVRDQQTGARDGNNQDGRYYVLESGDKGEVGIWRREADHWVDLLPWQRSDAVKTGTATNEMTVRAIGNTLSLSINGSEVATRTDATFTSGSAGVFVGGDGNVVSLDHFAIQTP